MEFFYFNYYLHRLSLLFPGHDYAYNFVGTLTHIGLGIDKVTFPTKGLTYGQNVFPKFLNIFYFQFLVLETQPLISLK